MSNSYWKRKIQLREAYESGYRSGLNEQVVQGPQRIVPPGSVPLSATPRIGQLLRHPLVKKLGYLGFIALAYDIGSAGAEYIEKHGGGQEEASEEEKEAYKASNQQALSNPEYGPNLREMVKYIAIAEGLTEDEVLDNIASRKYYNTNSIRRLYNEMLKAHRAKVRSKRINNLPR